MQRGCNPNRKQGANVELEFFSKFFSASNYALPADQIYFLHRRKKSVRAYGAVVKHRRPGFRHPPLSSFIETLMTSPWHSEPGSAAFVSASAGFPSLLSKTAADTGQDKSQHPYSDVVFVCLIRPQTDLDICPILSVVRSVRLPMLHLPKYQSFQRLVAFPRRDQMPYREQLLSDPSSTSRGSDAKGHCRHIERL
jgi:hypothetical protein